MAGCDRFICIVAFYSSLPRAGRFLRPRHWMPGFHSRTSFCACSICAGVILLSMFCAPGPLSHVCPSRRPHTAGSPGRSTFGLDNILRPPHPAGTRGQGRTEHRRFRHRQPCDTSWPLAPDPAARRGQRRRLDRGWPPRGVVLCGGLAVPCHGLAVVLRHPLTAAVQVAEIVLGHGVSVIGSLVKPFGSLPVVLRHSPAGCVHFAENVLAATCC